MGDAADDVDDLEQRLQRLAARRAAAARRRARRSSTPEGEADGPAAPPPPPQWGALQALRELLQQRQPELEAPSDAAGESSDAAMPRTSVTFAPPAAPPAAPFDEGITHPAAPLPQPIASASPEASSSGPPSLPATTRALITLTSGIGREEAQAERQARAAEAREAEAAVSEAEVRGGGGWHMGREASVGGDLAPARVRPRARSAPLRPADRPAAATSCPQAQRAQLAALLLRQQAAAAERQRHRVEREGELRRVQLELATHHMAACAPAAAAQGRQLPNAARRLCMKRLR